MQGNTTAPNSHRQLLMHCQVTNGHGHTSERFIDHAEFLLWRFLIEERHGLIIGETAPCIWIPEEQRRRHDKLFDHTPYHEPLNRLTFEKFDAHTGVTETQTRFLLACEMEDLVPVLERHLVADTAAIVVETEVGEAISTTPTKRWFRSRPIAAYCAA